MSLLSRNRTLGEHLGRGMTVEGGDDGHLTDHRGREVVRVDPGPGATPRRGDANHRGRRRHQRHADRRSGPSASEPLSQGRALRHLVASLRSRGPRLPRPATAEVYPKPNLGLTPR
ncbi:hypothetical protein [Streptomyces sp. NPDC087460]|uniref:hypothetical protein n=1 Tax=Streptomyces sp. NPDC087460 TaxID=3365791 RepID=UPI003819EAD8